MIAKRQGLGRSMVMTMMVENFSVALSGKLFFVCVTHTTHTTHTNTVIVKSKRKRYFFFVGVYTPPYRYGTYKPPAISNQRGVYVMKIYNFWVPVS